MTAQDEQPEVLDVDTLQARRVIISGSDRQPRIVLQCDEDGLASITVGDLHNRARVLVSVHPGGETHLSFHDKRGRVRLGASLTCFPFVQLCGDNGESGFSLAVFPDGSPKVLIPEKTEAAAALE